jgi:hypothetical protein
MLCPGEKGIKKGGDAISLNVSRVFAKVFVYLLCLPFSKGKGQREEGSEYEASISPEVL